MRKIIKIFSTLIILLLIFSTQVFAQGKAIEINSLIENAKQYDNKTIFVQGEAVGELLERKDYAWVNIHDGTNAIGIWMKIDDAKQVKKYGDYKNKGDILQISGVFHRACAEHGGEADIHNQNMQIIKNGHAVKEHVPVVKMVIAVILLLALLSLIFIIHKFKILKLPYHL